jgi:hypothetical protein
VDITHGWFGHDMTPFHVGLFKQFVQDNMTIDLIVNIVVSKKILLMILR